MVWRLRAGVIINVVGGVVPAEAVDEEADGEGSEHPSHREDGHRERPQSCQSGPRDGLWKPAAPRLIVEALNDLKHKKTDSLSCSFSDKTDTDCMLIQGVCGGLQSVSSLYVDWIWVAPKCSTPPAFDSDFPHWVITYYCSNKLKGSHELRQHL